MITGRLSVGDYVYIDTMRDGILSMHALMPQDIPDIYSGVVEPDRIFPIPITEKLLVSRCGFILHPEVADTSILRTILPTNPIINVLPNPVKRGSWLLCYKDVKIPIDALHELQNAFYCLFRTELEIK